MSETTRVVSAELKAIVEALNLRVARSADAEMLYRLLATSRRKT